MGLLTTAVSAPGLAKMTLRAACLTGMLLMIVTGLPMEAKATSYHVTKVNNTAAVINVKTVDPVTGGSVSKKLHVAVADVLKNDIANVAFSICSTRLNDGFPFQDSANRLIRIEPATCCGANAGS